MGKEKGLLTINQAELIDTIYSKYKTIIDVPKHINVRSQIAKGYARRLNEEAFG